MVESQGNQFAELLTDVVGWLGTYFPQLSIGFFVVWTIFLVVVAIYLHRIYRVALGQAGSLLYLPQQAAYISEQLGYLQELHGLSDNISRFESSVDHLWDDVRAIKDELERNTVATRPK